MRWAETAAGQRGGPLSQCPLQQPLSGRCRPTVLLHGHNHVIRGNQLFSLKGEPHTLRVGLGVTSLTVQMADCPHHEIFREQPLQVFMPSHSSCWEKKNAI